MAKEKQLDKQLTDKISISLIVLKTNTQEKPKTSLTNTNLWTTKLTGQQRLWKRWSLDTMQTKKTNHTL